MIMYDDIMIMIRFAMIKASFLSYAYIILTAILYVYLLLLTFRTRLETLTGKTYFNLNYKYGNFLWYSRKTFFIT